MTDSDFNAVRINRAAACKCAHHPLRHDLNNRLMTGGPAKCKEEGCPCADLEMAPGSPAPLSLE